MQSNNNAVAAPTNNNVPASPFVEIREHGKHGLRFPFTVRRSDVGSLDIVGAVKMHPVVSKLAAIVAASDGTLKVEVFHDEIEVTASRKGDFATVAIIAQAVFAMPPEVFAAEVTALLPEFLAREAAKAVAYDVKRRLTTSIVKAAETALADEIADLKARVEALSAKYAAVCAEQTQAALADDAVFIEAGSSNVALAREEALAKFAADKFSFANRFTLRG